MQITEKVYFDITIGGKSRTPSYPSRCFIMSLSVRAWCGVVVYGFAGAARMANSRRVPNAGIRRFIARPHRTLLTQ